MSRIAITTCILTTIIVKQWNKYAVIMYTTFYINKYVARNRYSNNSILLYSAATNSNLNLHVDWRNQSGKLRVEIRQQADQTIYYTLLADCETGRETE